MKKLYSFLALMLATVSIHAQSWLGTELNEYAYEGTTVVYAHLTSNLSDPNANIAAFIDGTCRAWATPEATPDDSNLYILQVRGDKIDNDKVITFKVFDQSTGFEYLLTPSEPITFEDMRTYGYPSGSINLSLTAPTSFNLSFHEAEVGMSYNLLDSLTVEPADAMMPENLDWVLTPADTTIVKVEGNILTAFTPFRGASIALSNTNDGRPHTDYCLFDIVQYATAITLLKTNIQVNKGDTDGMSSNLHPGISYQLEPEGSIDAVKWEIEDVSILQWDDKGYLEPIKGGTTRIRPYIVKKNGAILYPANDAWITVNVYVPVTEISINTRIYNGTFIANVGDTHIYERLKKMITVLPEDATDKSYTVSFPETDMITMTVAGKDTTLTAQRAGMIQVQVHANGAEETMDIFGEVELTIQNPVIGASISESTLYVVLEDMDSKDISYDIRNNVKWVTANGASSDDAIQGNLEIDGTSVTAAGSGLSLSGLDGIFTAVAEGTTTFTINLEWPDYDSWMGNNTGTLQNKTAHPAFQVVVTKTTKLMGFNVTYTNAVAGETGVLTLVPQPAGATFDVNNIIVNVTNGLEGAWGELLQATKSKASASQIVYEITSMIPGVMNLAVFNGNERVSLNDPGTTILVYEIGNPLHLAAGWQWRSNPYGAITQDSLANVFSTDDLIEIRTQRDLLYNDPAWGFYGTLKNTVGIKQGQCYKVNMKNAREQVLYGMGLTEELFDGTVDYSTGSITITLQPGWNWVGSPYFFDRKVETLFANVPEGTIIVGKTGSTEKSQGTWNGDLQLIKSGEGYVIKNPTESDFDLQFVPENMLSAANDEVNAGVKSFAARHNVWQYDHSRFMNNMTMVAQIEDLSQPEQYSIGAFVGDECRGEGIIQNGRAFITVHCNMGEYVTFKLYNAFTGEYRLLEEGLKAQTRVGSLKAPFTFHAGALVDGINGIADGAASSTETYDLSGRRADTRQRGVSVRRMADGSLRKVIVK